MLRHVVFWRFKPGVPAERRREMKERLEALAGVVPSLRAIEAGEDALKTEASMDMALCATFDDAEGLKAYAEHPAHLEVVGFVKPLVAERRVVDYVVE